MKVAIAVASVLVALIVAWFAYSARREAGYQATLARYEHELPPGTTRAEVQKYLDSQGVLYRPDISWSPPGRLHAIGIDLGTTSGDLLCTSKAYLELRF